MRRCRACASQRVIATATTPDGISCRCENCGHEWLTVERFIERRRGEPDRRRARAPIAARQTQTDADAARTQVSPRRHEPAEMNMRERRNGERQCRGISIYV